MLELASLVTEIVGNDAGYDHLPLPSDDPTQRQPDIAQARAVLDWESTVQLREGLTNAVEYFRKVAAVRRSQRPRMERETGIVTRGPYGGTELGDHGMGMLWVTG